MPNMMATMERIMTTSIATANTLIAVRRGRCNRLLITSLFISYQKPSGERICGAPGLGSHQDLKAELLLHQRSIGSCPCAERPGREKLHLQLPNHKTGRDD